MLLSWSEDFAAWLRSQWSPVSFVAGLVVTKIADFVYDRCKTASAESRDRKKLRKFVYKELADNYARLDDAVREYEYSRKDENAPTVNDIRIATERYAASRKDLMRFDELGAESRAIEAVYSALSGFRGMGNSATHWAIARATKKSIEDDLRGDFLDAKLLLKQTENTQRQRALQAILRAAS